MNTLEYSKATKSVFEKWVEQATRLFWPATRRPEWGDARTEKVGPYWLAATAPLRPASRRTAQASGLCYPHPDFRTPSKRFRNVH